MMVYVCGVGDKMNKKQKIAYTLFPGLHPSKYKPTDQARRFHGARDYRFVVVSSGSRAGKTYAAAREFCARIARDVYRFLSIPKSKRPFPSLLYWVVAPTKDLTTKAEEEIRRVANPSFYRMQTMNDVRGMTFTVPVRIEFRSGYIPDALRSFGINGAWVDEAAVCKERSIVGNLRSRLNDRRIGDTPAWCLYTTTPPSDDSFSAGWFERKIVNPARKGLNGEYAYFEFSVIGNTACPHLVEEAKKAERELDRETYEREFLGKWPRKTGLVFTQFDEQRHVYVRPMIAEPVIGYMGIDFGFGNSPSAIVVVLLDANGVFWVVDEAGHRNMLPVRTSTSSSPRLDDGRYATIEDATSAFMSIYPVSEISADPSRNDIIELLARAGYPVTGASVGLGASIDFLQELFKENHIFINEKCKNLIRELGRWGYDNSGSPQRGGDHWIDALRYSFSPIGALSLSNVYDFINGFHAHPASTTEVIDEVGLTAVELDAAFM
ncbi:hypothetical protein D6779_11135 [Candidatus Parcubacteria bacterium]|nr:MAG: hypothetical protein D6779_11135 [Candidatus Parcubacteria bacterium]